MVCFGGAVRCKNEECEGLKKTSIPQFYTNSRAAEFFLLDLHTAWQISQKYQKLQGRKNYKFDKFAFE